MQDILNYINEERLSLLQVRLRVNALLAQNKHVGKADPFYYDNIREGAEALAGIEKNLLILDEMELRARGYDPECFDNELNDIDISDLLNECL